MKNCLKIIHWDRCSIEEREKILSRPILDDLSAIKKQVKTIISDVNSLGDQALYNYTNIFDKIKLNNIKISHQDLVKAELCIDVKAKNAIQVAIDNIRTFHISQNISTLNIEINKGIYCQQIVRPIGSVGLYIPGGSAPLLSTVLMLAIPARIAGCKKIVLCSPPPITNEVLYASKICGVQEIFQVGGAQAIAALGFGTETIPKVNKIFGPGNAYVTEAKSQISRSLYDVGIDMLAGPSEVLIIADSSANVDFIASDLLSQSEHGNYSQVILITCDINLANAVLEQIRKQVKNLLRSRIIIQSLKHSKIIIVKNLLECFELSNYYAPEHLMIQCEYPQRLLKYVLNAGSIFLGHWSPVASGDYATGANHVLPTYGSAKAYSGLSLIDFQKRITVQKLDKVGFKNLASTIMSLSTIERLDAHTNSILIRLSSLMDEM
ncbi:histidinol dehydrogenase [Buchnera aphidicola]|nr:histidinol dehydrogenase [Buchnera aphidicola]QCI23133.1 histidinol dehydrogenase [Buchnera aphidicola (Melaphis rhois)]